MLNSLRKLKQNNNVDHYGQDTKSLIFKDKKEHGREEVHEKCKEAFDQLCKYDENFKEFNNLFAEEFINISPEFLHEFKDYKDKIRKFLCIAIPYLEMNCCLVSIEWFIFKFRAHAHQPEDLLMCFLPYYDSNIFKNFLQVLNLASPKFSWLQPALDSSNNINLDFLGKIAMKNFQVIEMITSWPVKFAEVTMNNSNYGKELIWLIMQLGVYVTDQSKLQSTTDIEKYISPFTNMIIVLLKSQHEDFYETSTYFLLYLNETINLNSDFLTYCIKLILNRRVQFKALKLVLSICQVRGMQLTDELNNLFEKNLSNLNENEIDEINSLKLKDGSQIIDETKDIQMKVETSTLKFNKTPKEKDVLREFMSTFKIDFNSKSLENDIIDVVNQHVLMWAEDSYKRISSKISLKILEYISINLQSKFAYRSDGLYAYLLCVLFHPCKNVSRCCQKIMKKWFKGIEPALNFSNKSEDISDLFERNSIEYVLALLEIICSKKNSLSTTILVVCMSVINDSTVEVLDKFPNLLTVFLENIQPHKKLLNDPVVTAARQSIQQLAPVFDTLSASVRISILDNLLCSETESYNLNQELICRLCLTVADVYHLLRPYKQTDLKSDNVTMDLKQSIKNNKYNSKKEIDISKNICFSLTDTCLCRHLLMAVSTVPNIKDMNVSVAINLTGVLFSILEDIVKLVDNGENIPKRVVVKKLAENLMKTLCYLLGVIGADNICDLDTLSSRVSLFDITKMLYAFQDHSISSLTLSVIRKMLQTGLGSANFNVHQLMAWLGTYLVSKDDLQSLSLLEAVIKETVPVCLRYQNKETQLASKAQLVSRFIEDTIIVPPHRAAAVLDSLTSSLSDDDNDSNLWLVCLMLIATETADGTHSTIDQVSELMRKKSLEEQLACMQKMLEFLLGLVVKTSRKRVIDVDPNQETSRKKRRLQTGAVDVKQEDSMPENIMAIADIIAIRTEMARLNINMSVSVMLETLVLRFTELLVSDMNGNLVLVQNQLGNLLASVFGHLRFIHSNGNTTLTDVEVGSMSRVLYELVDVVGRVLSVSEYMDLLVSMATRFPVALDCRCLQLVTKKLASLKSGAGLKDNTDMMIAVMRLVTDALSLPDKPESWAAACSAATLLMQLGLVVPASQNALQSAIEFVLTAELTTIQQTLALMLIRQTIESGYNCDFIIVLDRALVVLIDGRCNRDLVEAGYLLLHCLLDKAGACLIMDVGRLTTIIGFLLETLASESNLCLSDATKSIAKQLRQKIAEQASSVSLLSAVSVVYKRGFEASSTFVITACICMLGIHAGYLTRSKQPLSLTRLQRDNLYEIILSGCDLITVLPLDNQKNNRVNAEMVSIKVAARIFPLDNNLFTAAFEPCRSVMKSDDSAEAVIHRNIRFYRMIKDLFENSSSEGLKSLVEFVNSSEFHEYSAQLMAVIAGETTKKKKRSSTVKKQKVLFKQEDLRASDAAKLLGVALIDSLCNALRAHMTAEEHLGLPMVVSQSAVALMRSTGRALISVEATLELSTEQYSVCAEKHLCGLIVQLAARSRGDETLLEPLTCMLSVDIDQCSLAITRAVLVTLTHMRDALGNCFDAAVRDQMKGFLSDCSLYDDDSITDLANSI